MLNSHVIIKKRVHAVFLSKIIKIIVRVCQNNMPLAEVYARFLDTAYSFYLIT